MSKRPPRKAQGVKPPRGPRRGEKAKATPRPVSPKNGEPVPPPATGKIPDPADDMRGEPASAEEITRLCQIIAPEAIRVLRKVYRNTKASSGARVSAAAMVIERAYGKVAPAQAPVAKETESLRDLDQLSDAEIAAALKYLTRRAAPPGGDEASAH